MTRAVYKYQLKITDANQRIDTHGNAVVRHVAMQNGQLCVWIECEPKKSDGVLLFRVFGTGHPIEDDVHGRKWVWCGTTQDREFVWHVYAKN